MSSVQFVENSGSKPSIQDLSAFASRAKEIDVGSDDIVELGDDLGVGLMANPSKVSVSPKPPQRSVSFGSGGGGGDGGGGGMPQIQIKPVDDLEVVNLEAAPGASDIRIQHAEPAPFVIKPEGSTVIDLPFGTPAPAEDETKKKRDLLTKLARLDKEEITGNRMTMANSLEEIKQEVDQRTDSRNLEASIRFQRNALMTFVTGVELANDKLGHRLPLKPRLKGWSESVHTNIGDFDEIFEDLYDLYKGKEKMHPLLRLAGTLGVSATMYHLTNSAAERSNIPGMQDMMNEDPEFRQFIAMKMMQKMGGGFGNFMQNMMPPGSAPPGMAPPGPMGYGAPPPPQAPPAAASGRAPFNQASAAEPPRARREMRGPTGVDDILKAFEAERLMEANPIGGAAAGVFTPAGPPPSPPQGGRGGIDPMAEFLADDGSIVSGSTMNTERRRGRKRAVATPVGATLTLNV